MGNSERHRQFGRRRRAIEHVTMVMAVSERRACRAVDQHRSTQRRPVPPNPYRDRLVARSNRRGCGTSR